jgi:flagellar basal body-associated protein FliL
VSIGYDPKDKEISVEIGNRQREIQDLILKDISQKKAADLSPSHYAEVQAELMDMINMVMRDGKVKSVMFRQFVVQK